VGLCHTYSKIQKKILKKILKSHLLYVYLTLSYINMGKGIQEQIESQHYHLYKPFDENESESYRIYLTILGMLHISPELNTDYIQDLIKTNDLYNLTLALEILKSQFKDGK